MLKIMLFVSITVASKKSLCANFLQSKFKCKPINCSPLSVALAGASSPRGEPHLSLLKSHLLAAPFRLATLGTFPKGQARLIAFH